MKNISTYVLAQSSNTYAQYIADASEERFKVALTLCDSPSQLLIQREGNLMYYLYVRQHSSQERFGLCVVANGMMATDLERVFEVFEQELREHCSKRKNFRFGQKWECLHCFLQFCASCIRSRCD